MAKEEKSDMKFVTCTAPVNIAVIKYWGKRDETLVLPINGSISATLDQQQLRAKTTIAVSKEFTQDRMWLNGEEQNMATPRIQNVLKEIRRRSRKRKIEDGTSQSSLLCCHVHICSENNFPTAAGLASSAAGYACLVYSLAQLFKVEGDISAIARRGSGSACRSVLGGFVEWRLGEAEDGSDSIAATVATTEHWPEMRILVLVVSAKKKHIGSSEGMQVSVRTSDLLRYRAQHIVPKRMQTMAKAIQEKDFQTFAEETMKDSNQLHGCCLDTYPSISYMTDTSRDIQKLVHAINKHCGEIKVAYTYDAGPNACLYLLESDVPMVLALVKHLFPAEQNGDQFIRGLPVEVTQPDQEILKSIPLEPSPNAIQYIIHTKVGPGPQVLSDPVECLLNDSGLPKTLA